MVCFALITFGQTWLQFATPLTQTDSQRSMLPCTQFSTRLLKVSPRDSTSGGVTLSKGSSRQLFLWGTWWHHLYLSAWESGVNIGVASSWNLSLKCGWPSSIFGGCCLNVEPSLPVPQQLSGCQFGRVCGQSLRCVSKEFVPVLERLKLAPLKVIVHVIDA